MAGRNRCRIHHHSLAVIRLSRIAASLLCLFIGDAAGVVHAADWRDSLTRKPGAFPALRPLTARYEFGWSGFKAAEANATFSRVKGGKLQLDVSGRTVGAARVLWQLDSKAVSTCNAATLRPIKLRQTEAYSRKTMTTAVDFTSKGPETLRTPNPPDATPPKVKRFKFGEVHDLHSALLFVRSQPLRAGQTTRLCVFPSSSPYLAEITVSGREKVKVAGRQWPAIRCDLQLRAINRDDFKLGPHPRFKRATVWISDDPDRLLLKLAAEIFVGRVWMELDEVDYAKK
jgi:hypothetical protein